MKAPCQFVSRAKISPRSSVCLSLPRSPPRCFQRDLRHLAAAERASKNNNSPLFLLLKPVLCHCLPFLPSSVSPLSSLGSLSVSLYHHLPSSPPSPPRLSPRLKMNLPACAHALHHCQVPHGGPPPPSQTGHQPLAGIIPHLQNSPHCF